MKREREQKTARRAAEFKAAAEEDLKNAQEVLQAKKEMLELQ